ncbi:cobyrinate a,c-diamide synthase [Sphingomonas morindae]|uniref:Cobyrinate a,c-diamide synthase n=1 Tax=Sphingomonas morindae TaxID=1541170 RepID=A0ABY4X6L5_9SPHN|nr:cobyrinate a,c-diamide synthase [Sphingomonas morindae]USI72552.1 cobyrinate a,c-diamide synthase [Sphingomonas morindae]
MTPGLLIGAPASRSGKTSVMLGLARAFRDQGLRVQPFKSGPDYIDPIFHQAATGRPAFTLDSWAMPGALLDGLAGAGEDADLVLAEGSMGLFDGVARPGAAGTGASADLARRLGWPVLLVLDLAGQAQSAGATALGFAAFDPGVRVAGVILNRVASERHGRLARAGLERAGLPVFGALPRRAGLSLPERHLGLVQAAEHPALEACIADHAAFLAAHVDLAAVRRAAGATGPAAPPTAPARACPPPGQRIALAWDRAFSFAYPHILAGWRAAGAEILPFSPLADEPPDAAADMVWLPGGYPELHAGALAAALRFKAGLTRHAERGAVHGECGGYMVLGAGLVDAEGGRHAMAGLLGLETSYAARRLHLGYRLARLGAPLGRLPEGSALRGHEFHYSSILAQPDPPLAAVCDADGAPVAETGSRRGRVSGSFFHLVAAEAA